MNEMSRVVDFLDKAEIGDYVELDGKTVEVVNMVGGRYLCLDSRNEVVRLVGDPAAAYNFLKKYKGDDGYDPCG